MTKTILFDGTGLSQWTTRSGGEPNWPITEGYTTVLSGDLVSKMHFGDAHIHVEFCEPEQTDGNSGVYVHGCYEIQILKTHDWKGPRPNSCGAVYEMHTPLENVCLPPAQWQTYDIFFRAPRFDGDTITEHARLTMLHNGVLIHNNVELPRVTPGGMITEVVAKGPLVLQDHARDPVSFRNVWVKCM
jgi:hypothetical protein